MITFDLYIHFPSAQYFLFLFFALFIYLFHFYCFIKPYLIKGKRKEREERNINILSCFFVLFIRLCINLSFRVVIGGILRSKVETGKTDSSAPPAKKRLEALDELSAHCFCCHVEKARCIIFDSVAIE